MLRGILTIFCLFQLCNQNTLLCTLPARKPNVVACRILFFYFFSAQKFRLNHHTKCYGGIPFMAACGFSISHVSVIRGVAHKCCWVVVFFIPNCRRDSVLVVFVGTVTLPNYTYPTSLQATSTLSAYLATPTPLPNSCRLLRNVLRLTKAGDTAGSQLLVFSHVFLLPRLLFFPPVTSVALSIYGKLIRPVSRAAAAVGDNQRGARASRGWEREGGGVGGWARGIHLLWRSSRHSSVVGRGREPISERP